MKDTITPLNYTKEAIKDLSVMEKGLRSNAPLTSYIMRQVIDMLDSSVKFILPNCCDIIEPEEYRQTHFDLARLPYEPRQPGGCKLKTAPVRPVVAARPAEYVCSEDLFY